MKVDCINCGKHFEIRRPKMTIVGTDPEGCNVTWEYIECPRCKRKYTVCVKDGEQRRMIAAREPIKKLRERESFLRMIYRID